MSLWRVLLILALLGGLWHVHQNGLPGGGLWSRLPDTLASEYHPDLRLEGEPLQGLVPPGQSELRIDPFRLVPLATFQAEARVLGAEHYRLGREAQLSPVDLALGWGPMARDEVIKDIRVRQSGRFYFWRVDTFPIPRREIETNSANMHFIPATETVASVLKSVRAGDTVRFKGYLVRVEADDGWRWVSSTTRNDTGNGACEIVLIDDLQIL